MLRARITKRRTIAARKLTPHRGQTVDSAPTISRQLGHLPQNHAMVSCESGFISQFGPQFSYFFAAGLTCHGAHIGSSQPLFPLFPPR